MEALQTGLRSLIRIVIFIFGFVLPFLVGGYTIHFFTKDPDLRRRRFSRHATWWNSKMCWLFGIKILVKNPLPPNQKGLLVGNHLGFIDILVSSAIQPNLFVTSTEMRETPFLGLLTEMGGCLYVERRSRSQILNELGEIASFLQKGFRVILYPEATSTNGEGVLPFKRTLLTAAAKAGVPILPYVFNFREINGEPGFPMKYRDSVCWYGDIPFHTAMWRSLGIKNMVCEVEFFSPVYTSTDDDRAAVADAIRGMIVDRFEPVKKHETRSL